MPAINRSRFLHFVTQFVKFFHHAPLRKNLEAGQQDRIVTYTKHFVNPRANTQPNSEQRLDAKVVTHQRISHSY
jgi:hypothetical protein